MYQFYNPHPRGLITDDCAKRSIVVVTGKDYAVVQRELNAYKKITGSDKFNNVKNLRYALEVMNAKKIELSDKLTAEEFCEKYPKGRFILDMRTHWSSCVDGCIYDTWDCSKKTVNFAYEINTQPFSRPNLRKQVFKGCCTSQKISKTDTLIRIYDWLGHFVERSIPTEMTAGYVLCLKHSNYDYVDLDRS